MEEHIHSGGKKEKLELYQEIVEKNRHTRDWITSY